MSGWLTRVERLISPRVTAAMIATPVDSPSRPSIQLMLLIIPTIQKIVNPMAIGGAKRDDPGPERVVDDVDLDAEGDRPAASAIWPRNCQRARRSNRSSSAPSAAATAPPSSSAATPSGCSDGGTAIRSANSLTIRNPPATREERGRHHEAAAPRDRFDG